MKHLTKEEYFAQIPAENLRLNALADTIGQAYIDGIEYADKRYRDAISVALEKTGTKINPFFNIVLTEINKN